MAYAASNTPATDRNFQEFHVSRDISCSLSDMVFGFMDDGEELLGGFVSSCESGEIEAFDEQEEEKENSGSSEEISKKFWETQNQILQATLRRSNSTESNIRNTTKEAVKEIRARGGACGCGKELTIMDCRSCLMREVSGCLRVAGYDSAICKTKWRSSQSQHIPAGEHSFLDVITQKNSKKGEVRLIVELNFRAEFELARASDEYNDLVRRLPEIFVGKVEKLQSLIKILCNAGKKCMKAKKMHLGPWRKQRYMQAKWLSACERTMSMPLVSVSATVSRIPKPRASMLTFDLLDKLPNRTAVQVV